MKLSFGNLAAEFFKRASLFLGIEDATCHSSRAGAVTASHFFPFCALLLPVGESPRLQRFDKALARQFSVTRLGTGVLHCHSDASRSMSKGDRGGDLVYVLPARPRRAGKAFLHVFDLEAEPG